MIMTKDSESVNPVDVKGMVADGESGMDAEASEHLRELWADEDAAYEDWADDEEYIDREPHIDPLEDLPEMEIIMNNIYVM